jgi:hypothetical protein
VAQDYIFNKLKTLHQEHHYGKRKLKSKQLFEIFSENQSKILLVFDALDEASPSTQNELVEFTRSLSSCSEHIHILLSSRPGIRLDYLDGGAVIKDIKAQEHDMRYFVRTKVKHLSRLRDILAQGSKKIMVEIEYKIVSRANGMYVDLFQEMAHY